MFRFLVFSELEILFWVLASATFVKREKESEKNDLTTEK